MRPFYYVKTNQYFSRYEELERGDIVMMSNPIAYDVSMDKPNSILQMFEYFRVKLIYNTLPNRKSHCVSVFLYRKKPFGHVFYTLLVHGSYFRFWRWGSESVFEILFQDCLLDVRISSPAAIFQNIEKVSKYCKPLASDSTSFYQGGGINDTLSL